MNAVLSTVYSTILPSAPYVIAAYVVVLLAMGIYVAVLVRGTKKNERELATLESVVARMQDEGKDMSGGEDKGEHEGL